MLTVALSSIAIASSAYAQDVGAETVSPAFSPDEIVVTARRVSESLQRTPVSMAALNSDQLRSAGIGKIADIGTVVPGLNLFYVGSPYNMVYSIRGLSRGTLGFQQPAVTTYVNDVPTSVTGTNLPTYDLEGIQVLKGPQGTLFGRNSEAGAILMNTRKPTHDFNGYVETKIGDYSWTELTGAINVPLVKDVLAVRIAGNFNRRDGYTKNLSFPGNDFNQLHDQSIRVSLLAEPTDNLRNILVFDKFSSSTNGITPVIYTYDPNSTAVPNFPPFNGFGAAEALAAQQANGPRTATSPMLLPNEIRSTSLTNTTTLDVGSVQIKNIFGYRTNLTDSYVNQSGWDMPVVTGHGYNKYKQITDELQLSGKALDGTLNYIVGLFYLDYRPDGLSAQVVAPFVLDQDSVPLAAAAYYRDKSKSAFGQIGYQLSGISSALDGLSVDAGLRYSKDKHTNCTVTGLMASDPLGESDCLAGAGTRAASKEDFWSYTFGLNYQATDDVLIYGVTRRGYRAGGLNSPRLGGTLTGLQSFRPESVTDYEIGLKSKWDLGGVPTYFNVAIFQADYKDLQYPLNTAGLNQILSGGVDGDGDPDNNPTTIAYGNVGDGRVKGIEANLSLRPTPRLQLSGGLSYLDKKITKGTFVAPTNWLNEAPFAIPTAANFATGVFYGAPDFSYNAGVNYTLPAPEAWGELVAHANVTGAGTVEYELIKVPPQARLDLRLDWNSVMGSNIDLSAFVTNATNKLAIAGPGLGTPSFAFTSVYYNEPRIFGAQMRVRFGSE
ncbi:hypothetical protein JI59_21155 (plasmid) [Novosphingobium pentaromativorans US6-1]|nr:hypothetical protein JI59_21155 [Novosphingobium pentaromativorans US6-1]